MPQDDSDLMQKARSARDNLTARFIQNPDVVLIDIGTSSKTSSGVVTDEVIIRIHVREHWFQSSSEERPEFPREIDGIRVIIVPGDYQLQ
jgi:hypothetical protein